MATAVLLPSRPALHDSHTRSTQTRTSSDNHLHHRLALFSSNSHSRSSPSASESAIEQEYDRLRTLAQSEQDQCHSCFQRSSSAYHRGDHAAAHELSERGKEHGRQADIYARQASEYIFEQLNKPGLIDEDTVDLHGQYVSEAEEVLERELKEARRRGKKGLTVIVGRGNHSTDHISKLKPCVEKICRKHDLYYSTEEHNQGRIFIDLVSSGNRVDGHESYHYHHHHAQHSTPFSEKDDHHHQIPETGRRKIADWKRLNCSSCVVM